MQPQDDRFEAQDARATPSQTVGSTLRAARLRHGENLEQIADVLRIRPVFLQAIEEGRFQALPGMPYAIGFVRTYAEHLGLDSIEIVRLFKSEAAGLERKPSLSFPSPAPEGRVPGTAALLISLVAVTVVFAGWYLYQAGSERLAPRVPEVPERLAAPSASPPGLNMSGLGDTPAETAPPSPAAAAATAPNAPPPAAVVSAPVAPAPTGPGATPVPGATSPAPRVAAAPSDAALPPPPGDQTRRLAPSPTPSPSAAPAGPGAPPATEAEDSPPPDPTALGAPPPGAPGDRPAGAIPPVPQVAAVPTDGRVFGAQNTDSRVVIKARGESWVQIRDATNSPLLTRVLRPGDSYRVPNKAGLVLMTGNAGVLDVFVDGAAAPSLGAVGAVRRNITLDAERLRAGAAGTE